MTYTFTYDGENYPKWEKSYIGEGGESLSVLLVFENEDERLQLSAEQVYVHMENMLQYVKDKTNELSLVQLPETDPDTYSPFHGEFEKSQRMTQEIEKWWNWAYFNNSFDVEEPA
jgi:hypothetical protein